MSIRILLEECIGETRAVAIDGDGQAFALFVERWAERQVYARWGDVHAGRLTRLAPMQGGGFATLASGEEVFLRSKELGGATQGASVRIQIEAEARRGKLARGRLTQAESERGDTMQRWLGSISGGSALTPERCRPNDPRIISAFEEALAPGVTLPGGGILRFSETPALIAVDIDTAGRNDAGRAYDRAQSVNMAAVREAARQLSLRGLGGAVVIDCVAPLRKEVGGQIKRAFLEAFRSYSPRKIEALAPSPFGLLEAVLAWHARPISHALLDDAGAPTMLTQLLSGLRTLEQQLVADRAGTFVLHLPADFEPAPAGDIDFYTQKLQQRYGARGSIRVSPRPKVEVEKL